MDTITFEIVRTRIRIDCLDRVTADLFRSAYGHLAVTTGTPDLTFSVVESGAGVFRLEREGVPTREISGLGWLLAQVDDDLVIALQQLHPDLYFLHAAVLARNGAAYLFPAPTGSGKSTLAWALSNRGFGYLSDELAPLELSKLEVLPFLRPLCLKEPPPEGHEITQPIVETERAIHISPEHLPGASIFDCLKIGAIFFPRYDPNETDSGPRRVSPARAAVRIYANCLNALAHPEKGLAAAESLAKKLPCFEVATARLEDACQKIRSVVDSLGD
ncbi:MAG: hypothetical protein P8Y44_05040 [Acidobacteriota bacterium]